VTHLTLETKEEDKKLKEAPDHPNCRSLKRVDHGKVINTFCKILEVDGLYRLQNMLFDTYSTVQRRKENPAILS
jgi:hypothetical protein